ncbi:demeter-like 1 [Euphorbia peplus]|nr:demeter-like 1 [Euphorbia peplus]
MEIGRDNRNEQVEESWIPPFKPILPEPQIIYTDRQGYQMDSPNFCQGAATFGTWGACSDFGNGSLQEAAFRAQNSTSGEIPWSAVGNGSIMGGFTSLLALQDHASAALLANTSDFLLGSSDLWSSDNFRQSSPNGMHIPFGSLHDLNLLPGETADSDLIFHRTTNQMAPLTPGKTAGGAECRQLQNTCTNGTENDQESENSMAAVDNNRLQTDTQLRDFAKEATFAAMSTAVTENGSEVVAPCETPQQQKPRRRKHRPRVITEGKPRIRKPATPPKPPATPAENPTGKRKYVRKQPLDKLPTTPPNTDSKKNSTDKGKNVRTNLVEPTEEPTSSQAHKSGNHSCRRSLNFDIEGGGKPQGKDVSGGCQPKLTVDFGRGIEVIVEPTRDLSRSIDQMRKKYGLWTDIRAPNDRVANKDHTPKRKWDDEYQMNHEERGDDVTPDYAHQQNLEMVLYNSHLPPLLKTNAVNWEDRKVMLKEVEVNRVAWTRHPSAQQQDSCSSNVSGVYYNAVSAYEAESRMKSSITSRNMTLKGQNSTTSSVSCMTYSKEIVRQGTIGALGSKMQSPSSILTQMEGSTRKRSRTPTRLRDVTSLTKIARGEIHSTFSRQQPMSYNVHGFGDLNTSHTNFSRGEIHRTVVVPRRQQSSYNVHQVGDLNLYHACDNALAAQVHKPPTKKRTKERLALVNYESSITNEQSRGKIMLNNQNRFQPKLLGTSPEEIWVSWIVQKFQQLNISRESSDIAYEEQNALVHYSPVNEQQNALVPYSPVNEQQNALVLYRRDGTVVPFTGPVKKRRPRPKVDLDEETTKVWRLLLENINNQGVDGTDEEKAKWWKEEREVFRGRADSFIARMHQVQGDRRFTPWKGSVVDSVVGVFLTQNVSDHLSSSAFMSLAAHFPLKSSSCEAMRDSASKEPIVCIPDLEDAINDMSSQSFCDQSSMILHDSEPDSEHDVERGVDYSNESTLSSTAIVNSTSSGERFYDSMEKRSTTDLNKTIDACYVEGKRKEINDAASSQNSVVSSQNSADSPIAQTGDGKDAFSENNLETDQIEGSRPNSSSSSGTFMELLMKAGRKELHEVPSADCSKSPFEVFMAQMQSTNCHSHLTSELKDQEETRYPDIFEKDVGSHVKEQSSFTSESAHQTAETSRDTTANDTPWSNIQEDIHLTIQSQDGIVKDLSIVENSKTLKENSENMSLSNLSGKHQDTAESSRVLNIIEKESQKGTELDSIQHGLQESKMLREMEAKRKGKSRRVGEEIRDDVDWAALRIEAESNGRKREKTPNTMDSLDWEAVRCADVDKVANTIKERGMNNILAGRIKDFLNRLVKEHGSIDLEWLRDVPPDKAKEYLLSIRGLGLKSVECVRLLTLHHLAFPVDTNVGRIAVRLGWVPLQPLPESLQLHLLELYPVLESIQRYLWPRLCKLDQKMLYELHYQMITFGKVFCTKNKPNCNACPMKGECRHFASAFASARLALPGPEEKSLVSATENRGDAPNPAVMVDRLALPLPQATEQPEENQQLQLSEARHEVRNCGCTAEEVKICQPIVEEPSSPEQNCNQVTEIDIEDTFCEDPNEIPTIKLNIEQFTQNLQTYMQNNMELQEAEMSKALVALTAEAASIPTPKLKNISRLRTEHNVYELPDSHPLLQGLDRRETDDPCSYLLAIWTPGETPDSIQPPESTCNLQEHGKLCDEKTCFSCNSIREANSQIVRGTLLIPCRTAMRGSFPLNGTYFQVNEVFADHDSSLNPIDVPRSWIWNLPRRTVYFGTSVPTIFKGLTTESIQQCFWRGYVCVRGFDQKTRAPRPLLARLHFPASRLKQEKGHDRNE